MIIIKTNLKINSLTQNKYNNIIMSINLSRIECHKCHNHSWSFHASYKRYIDFFGLKRRILITRIICKSCKTTHAILIEDMIPYSCLSFEDIITLLSEDHEYIDSSHLNYLKHKYLIMDYIYMCMSNKRSSECIFST